MTTDRSSTTPRSQERPASGHYTRIAGLLAGAQAGDRAALAELIAELTPLLWQVARAQGLDQDTSADVVQTTWLYLLGSLDKIRNPLALTGWLVTATRREAWRTRDAGRAEVPADEDSLVRLLDAHPPTEQRFFDEEQRRSLWACVGRLSKQCQELLRIVAFVHRPDYDAVSTALGMRRGSIGPTRGRCLAKLRSLMVADGDGAGHESR